MTDSLETTRFRKTERRFLRLLIVGSVILLFASRLVCLTHNLDLHPDEYVFSDAAESMLHYLWGVADSYEEVKEYPEGAIVLQFPFHVLGAVYRHFGGTIHAHVLSRIASVCYFAAATVLGIVIEYRYLGKNRASAVIFSLTMLFSLFHIEQSRYGTGDAISIFLLLFIILLTAVGCEQEKVRAVFCWLGAAFLSGLLCAVKYPLLFWASIPVVVICRKRKSRREQGTARSVLLLAAVFAAMLIAFLFASPKLVAEPGYLYHALGRETYAYLLYGNLTELGGPLNHLVSFTVYSLFYVSLPLAPLFFLLEVKKRTRQDKDRPRSDESFLFGFLLPLLSLLFLIVNILPTTQFFRTYYPFFILMDLYAAAYLGHCQGRKARAAVACLLLLTMLRGSWLICLLSRHDDSTRLNAMIAEVTDDAWESTTILSPGSLLSLDKDALRRPEYQDLMDARFETPEGMKPRSGELIITKGVEYTWGGKYLFPVTRHDVDKLAQRWQTFKTVNRDSFAGSSYPRYHAYVFGFWLKGSTGSSFEFPLSFLYYTGA